MPALVRTALAAALLSAPTGALAATSITASTTLTASSGALTIDADNITVDCSGYSIVNDGTESIGILIKNLSLIHI